MPFSASTGRLIEIHFLSLAGYAYANHRVPCLDYDSGVLAATKKITKSDKEVEKAFRLMLFNVLAHNKDDHSKNFSYLLDPSSRGAWQLAPAFDLTFSSGMSNHHTTAISGSGNPEFSDLEKMANKLKVKNWLQVLDDVRGAVARWPEFAGNYGMTKARSKAIQKELNAIDKVCRPN